MKKRVTKTPDQFRAEAAQVPDSEATYKLLAEGHALTEAQHVLNFAGLGLVAVSFTEDTPVKPRRLQLVKP